MDGPAPNVSGSAHAVQFYEDDVSLVDSVARFIGGGLGAGDGAVVIATARHREGLARQLEARGLDLAGARAEGRYVALDAAETLRGFMRDGWPDASRFDDVVGGALVRAARGSGSRVLAFGEMVALLWVDGRRDAAIRLERLWSSLVRTRPVALLCAYPMGAFGCEADATSLREVCAQHSEVVPAESYTSLATVDERLRAVTRLQQKAWALETEVARRRTVEETLRQQNRAKDQFLAMLGHELRNPLSAVQNAVVTARLDPVRRERALEIASRGADQLGRLVDDLLDVARITQGRIALHTRRLRFADVVERAVEVTRPLIERRAHHLTLALPDADVQLDGDSLRLEQVIANLVTNAAKYTDPGGRIAVTAEYAAGEVVLRVCDDGIGIVPEMLPRVFDLFAQGDRTLDRAQGGLGVGLTVARRLVELHGGRIEVHSEGPGRGAEFVVWLPAVLASREEAASAAAAVRGGRTRILLVEDNDDAAESLMMLLELLGHRVRVASDGPTALEAARTNAPDVMLVDIGLPGMDGYEIARRVRHEPALRDVVLVALTGYGRDEDRQRAFAAGFDYHLVKPVNADALQGLVAQVPARRDGARVD